MDNHLFFSLIWWYHYHCLYISKSVHANSLRTQTKNLLGLVISKNQKQKKTNKWIVMETKKIFSYLLFHSHLITPYIFVNVIDVVAPVLGFLCASVWYHFFYLFGFLSFRNNNYNWVRNLFLLISFFLFFSPFSVFLSLFSSFEKKSSL